MRLLAPAPTALEKLATDGALLSVQGVEVRVRPAGPSPLFGLLYLLGTLPWPATWMLTLWHLVRGLRGARLGDRALFSAATAGQLRRLGWTLIIGSVVAPACEVVSRIAVSEMLLRDGYPLQPVPLTAPFVGAVAGLVALGVAEIIRRGLALLEEVESTI